MTRPFEVHAIERAYVRRASFGIELLDAVTLAPVGTGVRVVAVGLRNPTPRINASGIFVWLEDPGSLRTVTIDPGLLPYQPVEVAAAQLDQNGLNRLELLPRVDYAFDAGTTGLRGALIESRVGPRVPVGEAVVRLRWLHDNGAWRDAPAGSRTDTKSGDFAAVVRFAPADVPKLVAGALTVRLRARRAVEERESGDLKLPQGRVADPSTFPQGRDALIFAWDQLDPLP